MDGSGAKPEPPVTCTTCGGRGRCTTLKAFSRWRRHAHIVRGKAPLFLTRTDCHGTGLKREEREVNIKIPAGVDDGTRLREGEAGERGGPTGDLYVFLHVKASKTRACRC